MDSEAGTQMVLQLTFGDTRRGRLRMASTVAPIRLARTVRCAPAAMDRARAEPYAKRLVRLRKSVPLPTRGFPSKQPGGRLTDRPYRVAESLSRPTRP